MNIKFNARNKHTNEIFSVKQIDYEAELINNEINFCDAEILPVYHNTDRNREDIFAGQVFEIPITEELINSMRKNVTEKGLEIVNTKIDKTMYCTVQYLYPCMKGAGFNFLFFSDILNDHGFNLELFKLDTYGAYLCRNFGKPIGHISALKELDEYHYAIKLNETQLTFELKQTSTN